MNNKDFKREYPTLYGINIGFQVLGWLLLICSVVLIIIGTSNINRYDMTDFYIFIASAIGTSILAI